MNVQELTHRLRIMTLTLSILILLLSVGCASSNNQDQLVAYTVLNKEIKSEKYLLEVSNQDSHEYIEIAMGSWNQINIGDTVSFDSNQELVRINNKPVEISK
jgi:hypothetical protein